MSLSDKYRMCLIESSWESDGEAKEWTNLPFYSEEDVKEAVKELKEELTTNKFYEDQRNIPYADWLIETIDKIFGEKLTDG